MSRAPRKRLSPPPCSPPVPRGLTAWNGGVPERRYGVYRNNVVASLIAALTSHFPVTERIVGLDFFRVMAQTLLQRHPPRSPLLCATATIFRISSPVSSRQERLSICLMSCVWRWHAGVPTMPQMPHRSTRRPCRRRTGHARRARLHAASSTVDRHLPHPVVTIRAMNASGRPVAPIDDWRSEDATSFARV